MCEWDSKGQCLSAYKIVNENSVVTLYLYETKLTRIIKFCSILFIYAHSFETGVCSCERYGPYASCFFNLSLWVCIIHYAIGVGRGGGLMNAWSMLVSYLFLVVVSHTCFFFDRILPLPLLHEKKRKNSKNCKLRIYRIWWAAFFFSLSSFSKLSQSHFSSLNV